MMFVNTAHPAITHGKRPLDGDIIKDISPETADADVCANGGLVEAFEPPAVSGRGQLWRIPIHAAGPGRKHAQRPGPRGAPDGGASAAHKELTGLFTTFSANDPQELVTIDREKAKAMGVSLSQITTTLNVFMGSEYINDFDYNNRTYRVFVQADQPFRMKASDLHSYYVRSDSGQMVPLDNLGDGGRERGTAGDFALQSLPLGRDRRLAGSGLQLRPGARGHGEAGHRQHDARHDVSVDGPDARRARVQRQGARDFRARHSGCLSHAFGAVRELRAAVHHSAGGADGGAGRAGLVSLRGFANDVYCQIGLVMLIGLSAKNSILIVEFAEQLRRKGRSIAEAAIEAGELRLRPILMTSFAFIMGVLPLVFATGAGALGRRSVGTTIVGGMLLSTVLNLVFIPVLYVILSRLLRRGPDADVSGLCSLRTMQTRFFVAARATTKRQISRNSFTNPKGKMSILARCCAWARSSTGTSPPNTERRVAKSL
jgi:hydrophobic/amphiphilic exporter-1 (mainly G- bacteria), HAE1 family